MTTPDDRMMPRDSMIPLYLINPLILERFRNHPEEWRREWMNSVRRRNHLDNDLSWWQAPAPEESLEACAALLWWVSYNGVYEKAEG